MRFVDTFNDTDAININPVLYHRAWSHCSDLLVWV
jgi:hypothetical protein